MINTKRLSTDVINYHLVSGYPVTFQQIMELKQMKLHFWVAYLDEIEI